VDQLGADRGGRGSGVTGAGEAGRGAHHVERNGGKDEPGGVGAEPSGRQVRQGPVLEVGDDLFDDRVLAVGGLGVDQG
jgi:hypothetical protein